MAGFEWTAQLGPQVAPRLDGQLHRIDAQQRHTAQDERHHRGVEGRATGQSAGRHRTAVLQGAQHIGQRGAADAVHRRGPSGSSQGARLGVGVGREPADHLCCAQRSQLIGVIGLSGRCHHVVAGGRQQIHADRPDTTGRAGHHDRAILRADAVTGEGLHAHRGGEPGGADRRALARTQRAQCDHLVGGQPRVFGVAAVMAGADLIAVGQHRVTRREIRRIRCHHLAGQVDAGNDRIIAHHTAFGCRRQCILEVDAGIQHRMVTSPGGSSDACSVSTAATMLSPSVRATSA